MGSFRPLDEYDGVDRPCGQPRRVNSWSRRYYRVCQHFRLTSQRNYSQTSRSDVETTLREHRSRGRIVA